MKPGLLAIVAAALFSVSAAAEIKLEFIAASTVSLGNPHDLKLSPDGRYLFVSDVDNDRVAILDPDTLEFVAEFGADHQGGTHDVDFDRDGRVYVADTHNNRVTIYELNGTEAQLVGELSEGLRGPEGVLVHPNGDVYVAGAWSGNMMVYRDGVDIAELRGLSSPHDLEYTADGDIWIADSGRDRLLLVSPELEVKRKLERETYDFNGVRYLDLTADGMIVAADKNNHQVKFIAADGSLVHVMGDGRPGQGINKFRTPEGVEIRNDELWLSDSGNDRVVKYRFSRD